MDGTHLYIDISTNYMNHLYRPEWTCGRYDEKHRVAIYYNLIEGMAYFFEDYSATVIGEVLNLGRNGHISIEQLSKRTCLSRDNLIPFLEELIQLNLITTFLPTPQSIEMYRRDLYKHRSILEPNNDVLSRENLPIAKNTAEMEYSDKINGIGGVMFELTYNCSEKCIHCYNIGATRNDTEKSHRDIGNNLTLDEYKRIIDEFYSEGLYKVCLTGGDPFVNPIVWDILDYLYKRDIAFDIYTNGLKLVDSVDKLLKYYPRLVSVSLYSDIAEVHDYITRVNGSWRKTMSVIEQLSEKATPMNLKCCIMQPNVKSYRGVSAIGKKYGIPVQYELNITDSIDGDKCASKYLRLSPNQMETVLCDVETPMYVGKEVENYGRIKRSEKQIGCSAGIDSFNITPDGKLVPCCAFHLDLGDLHKEKVRDIINNSEKLKWWRNLPLSEYEDCGKEEYCAFCNLCPGNNFSEYGTPVKCSENNKFMAKARYNLMLKKKNGIDPLEGMSIQEKLLQLPDYKVKKIKRELKSIRANGTP